MNRIVLIGNGFDLAHGLPTKYENFINWYWEKRVNSFAGNLTSISEDCLCSIKITSDNDNRCWNVFAFCLPKFINKPSGKEIIEVGSINSIFYFLHKAAEPFNCLEQDNLA